MELIMGYQDDVAGVAATWKGEIEADLAKARQIRDRAVVDLGEAERHVSSLESLLAMARQSGDVLFGLINDILDMSQMEAGQLSVRPSLFELRPVLDSCAEMFAAQAAQRGLTLRVSIADGTPDTLLTDPGRLRQVQFLGGAREAQVPGDRREHLELAQRRVLQVNVGRFRSGAG